MVKFIFQQNLEIFFTISDDHPLHQEPLLFIPILAYVTAVNNRQYQVFQKKKNLIKNIRKISLFYLIVILRHLFSIRPALYLKHSSQSHLLGPVCQNSLERKKKFKKNLKIWEIFCTCLWFVVIFSAFSRIFTRNIYRRNQLLITKKSKSP